MKRVILESPFAGDIDRHVNYARGCIRDCLMRGEAPLASHLLYTQPGILRDESPMERALGIGAGHAWVSHADLVVVYTGFGISSGMQEGIKLAEKLGIAIDYRKQWRA